MALFSRWLFRFTCLAAVVLLALVILAPLLDNDRAPARSWEQVMAVFARDSTLRRTSVASAVGLWVTAYVFFRTPGRSRSGPSKRPKVPPPTDVVGA